jgi:tetratricopeptide (TPR) repeat protein
LVAFVEAGRNKRERLDGEKRAKEEAESAARLRRLSQGLLVSLAVALIAIIAAIAGWHAERQARNRERLQSTIALNAKEAEQQALDHSEATSSQFEEIRLNLGEAVRKAEELAQLKASVEAVGSAENPAKVLAVVQKVVEEKPVSARERATALWQRGYWEYTNGDRAQARALYEQAQRADSTYAAPYNSLGRIAYEANDLAAADELYQKALNLNPRYAPALHNRALVAMKRNDLDLASNLTEQALKASPGYSPSLTIRKQLLELRSKNKKSH